jgi:hypothetical protein
LVILLKSRGMVHGKAVVLPFPADATANLHGKPVAGGGEESLGHAHGAGHSRLSILLPGRACSGGTPAGGSSAVNSQTPPPALDHGLARPGAIGSCHPC